MSKLDRFSSGDFFSGSSSTPQAGITWGVEVAKGLDRLKIGFYAVFENKSCERSELNELFEILDSAKQDAKLCHDVSPIVLDKNGEDRFVFNCHSSGRHGGYAYHISRADVHIFFSRRKDMSTPNVLVDIGSLSCWNPGFDTVLQTVHDLIENYGGRVLKNTISEVHLCADVIGQDIEALPLENYRYWITRANKFGSYRDRRKLEGVTMSQNIGRLGLSDSPEDFFDPDNANETGVRIGKGDIMLRVYDKVLELKHDASKQAVFASVWGKESYDESAVTRVEFQLRRPVLKQMGVNSLEDLREKISGVWKYLTQDWTRLSVNPVDRDNRHQDRAVMHPWWQTVQTIKWDNNLVTVFRKKKVPTRNIEHLLDLMVGCSISLGTILERKTDDIEGVIAMGQGYLETRLRSLYRQQKKGTKVSEFVHKMLTRHRDMWCVPLPMAA